MTHIRTPEASQSPWSRTRRAGNGCRSDLRRSVTRYATGWVPCHRPAYILLRFSDAGG